MKSENGYIFESTLLSIIDHELDRHKEYILHKTVSLKEGIQNWKGARRNIFKDLMEFV